MRIHHIATRSDWEQARSSGTYTTSTVGRTLADEGFIHASRRDQVAGVFRRYYADIREPLVLLTIDTDRLDAEVREEPVGADTYPHIYGPITPRAVVSAVPLNRRGTPATFFSIFLHEMLLRMAVALVVLACAVVGMVVGGVLADSDGMRLAGAGIGLAVGAGLAFAISQRSSSA